MDTYNICDLLSSEACDKVHWKMHINERYIYIYALMLSPMLTQGLVVDLLTSFSR